MAEDLSFALGEVATRKVSLETAATALSLFQHAINQGHGEEGFFRSQQSLIKEFLNPEQL